MSNWYKSGKEAQLRNTFIQRYGEPPQLTWVEKIAEDYDDDEAADSKYQVVEIHFGNIEIKPRVYERPEGYGNWKGKPWTANVTVWSDEDYGQVLLSAGSYMFANEVDAKAYAEYKVALILRMLKLNSIA